MKFDLTKEECLQMAEAGYGADPKIVGSDPSKELIDDIAKILEGHTFALRADEHHRKVAREIFQKIVSG